MSTWSRKAAVCADSQLVSAAAERPGDQVEQPGAAGAVQHRGQVDDDRDIAVVAGSAGV